MKGQVVSYWVGKRYGFIMGDNGIRYFLNSRHLVDVMDEKRLVKGIPVEFDPIRTPKGDYATKVSISEVFFKRQLTDFFMSKRDQPKLGRIEAKAFIETRFFEEEYDAKEHLLMLADDCNANAVLQMKHHITSFSKHKYKYEMHSYSGQLSVVTKQVPCGSPEQANLANEQLEEKKSQFLGEFDDVFSTEQSERERQLKPPHSIRWWMLFGTLVVGLGGTGVWIFVT
ncbi:cold-shock protein [Vibrio zhugei]|uniref:Cold-shock protein n=1 Tax=Vibrio zhugei TaxID=2479546 RepID=A0ABV7C9E5_9VIBR|nr:cold shock domain-containing protein [Vibrio zhugei]